MSALTLDPHTASDEARAVVRSGARAAMAAAVLGILGDLYHVTFDRVHTAPVFKIHGVLLIAALTLAIAALFALRIAHGGMRGFGRVGFWLALFGTVLVAGDIYYEIVVTPGLSQVAPGFVDADPSGWHLLGIITSYALFGGGWLLVGIATAMAGLVSRAGAVILAVGGLIGFTPLPGSYLLLFVGLGLIGAGMRVRA